MAAALQPIPTVSPVNPVHETLVKLLGEVPLFPFPALVTGSEMAMLLDHRVADWVANPDVRIHLKQDAAAAWKPLSWDTAQFGFPAARVEFAAAGFRNGPSNFRECLAALLNDCVEERIHHLTARASTSDLFLVHALEGAGFQLMDGIQTFALRLTDFAGPALQRSSDLTIGLLQPWHVEGVVDLADRAYQFDRFHADSALSTSIANRLHREWLRNSCSGKAADAVFVAARENEVLSYVTLSFDKDVALLTGKKLATIVLVATSEKARGKGLARMTTLNALHWLKAQGCDAVTVGTQFRNIPAGRLYESCGFRLAATSLTFRKLLATKGNQNA
ncbi:MAG: GNAT family N-acetyltransferase [Acidobacteria bacterium]|nr:GNAT family N-acetyltransferase [Acidobacteriota bacterium]